MMDAVGVSIRCSTASTAELGDPPPDGQLLALRFYSLLDSEYSGTRSERW